MTKQILPGYKQTEVGIIPEDWDVVKLGDIANIQRGASPRPISDTKWFSSSSKVGWVRISDVTRSNRYLNTTEQYLSEDGINNSRYIEPGNILMSICATIGKPIYTNIPVCIHDGFIVFANLLANKNFMLYSLQHWENRWYKYGQPGSQTNLNTDIVSNELIPLPPQKEQEKIAEILSTWDEAITKQEQLIEQKQVFKKGIMQQIFSQKLRFKDDHGNDYPAWQSKKLGDIGKVSMCKRILKDETLPIGEVPFFKIGTFGGKADAYITRELYEKYIAQYPFPKAGDILISASGTIGRTVIYNGKPSYFQDSNIVWISNNEKLIQNRFLYFHYKMIKWNTEDTTIARLYNDNLRAISINTPCHDEQDKIANFLTSLDDEITKQTEILSQLKLQKQSLMQKLLTGQVRVSW